MKKVTTLQILGIESGFINEKLFQLTFANSPPLHQCSCSVVSLTVHDQQHSDDAISQSQDKFQEVCNINSSEQGKILKEPLWKEF